MTATDYILIGIVMLLLLLSVFKSRPKTKKALKNGASQFWNVLPFFFAVFGLIGLLEVLLTPAIVKTWLGSESGMLAPLYAAVFGGMATGPPAAVFPLGKYLLTQQASVAAVATLLTVFVFVGLFQVWINDEFIMKHLGDESGIKGLALGAGLGTILHGPLIGVFPLLQALLAKGAKLGVVVAIVSTWAIKLPMIPLEIKLFGWKFALLRNGLLFVSAFVMAPLMEWALGTGWVDRFRGAPGEE